MTEEQTAGTTAAERTAVEPTAVEPTPGAAYADCVLCGEPTEHLATVKGATLCPVCAWQEAQRTACSG
ncbi:hypothetical protein [Streptomyces corynorhini]|uniref:Uncharacterized protein n=1 Tax=Streptomyces corynorhini TaxID=2282652 RepID=A0A370BAH0_9ACTN|nr:hypothetical protein [Streptomyces corynorhini]RDG37174.1 hypothetical protein DVH02_15955 [Streptomyces corynorhini]